MSLRRNIKTQQDLDSSCGFYWLDANLTSRCIKPACWPHVMQLDTPRLAASYFISQLDKGLDKKP